MIVKMLHMLKMLNMLKMLQMLVTFLFCSALTREFSSSCLCST